MQSTWNCPVIGGAPLPGCAPPRRRPGETIYVIRMAPFRLGLLLCVRSIIRYQTPCALSADEYFRLGLAPRACNDHKPGWESATAARRRCSVWLGLALRRSAREDHGFHLASGLLSTTYCHSRAGSSLGDRGVCKNK